MNCVPRRRRIDFVPARSSSPRLVVSLALLLAMVFCRAGAADSLHAVFEPFPIVSYDTDVGFGYGAKLFFLHQLHASESIDLTLFNSTKGERWYRLVCSFPDFELRQGRVYNLAIDLTIEYDRWTKNSFFGTGNMSRAADREVYTREPLDILLTASRGMTGRLVISAGLRWKSVRNFNFEEGSRLRLSVPAANGGRAGTGSFFAVVRDDGRDHYVNPHSGFVVQGEAEVAPKIGSSIALTRGAVTVQEYVPVGDATIALRGSVSALAGPDIPVQFLLSVGGNNTLRGFPQDRLLGRGSAVANGELRFPIWWRFGGVAGVDAGNVWNSVREIGVQRWKANAVAGLRFYMNTFVVRADVGVSSETTGIYFNFGQIF